MEWKQLLASLTSSVDAELRLRNAYLLAENRILRRQITGRVLLTDAERKTFAESLLLRPSALCEECV